MPLNFEKIVDKNGILYFWTLIKGIFAKKDECLLSVKVNGSALERDTTGAVNIAVPTAVSALTNDSGYMSENAVNTAISAALSGITGIEFVKLTADQYNADTGVPTITGAAGKIYLTQNSGSAPNQYDEYIYIAQDDAFEKIGTTDIDLSGYVLASELTAITNAEIDAICKS